MHIKKQVYIKAMRDLITIEESVLKNIEKKHELTGFAKEELRHRLNELKKKKKQFKTNKEL